MMQERRPAECPLMAGRRILDYFDGEVSEAGVPEPIFWRRQRARPSMLCSIHSDRGYVAELYLIHQ